MRWISSTVFWAFFFFIVHEISANGGKKKIVKLIVPHKIKYIHHTHVLLVKPAKKKKSAKIQIPVEELEGDDESANYYHEAPRLRNKVKLRYSIIPYAAEDKEGNLQTPEVEEEEEIEPYYPPLRNAHIGRLPVGNELHHPKISRSPKRHAYYQPSEVAAHSAHHPTKYVYPPQPNLVKAPFIDPQKYDTQYIGYSSYAADAQGEPTGPQETGPSGFEMSLTPHSAKQNARYGSYHNYNASPYGHSTWVNG